MSARPSPGPIPLAHLAPIAHAAMRCAFRLAGGIASYGMDNVPLSGPVIYCPNHLSDCDPAALYATTPRDDIYFIAKDDFFRNPALAAVLISMGCIPIKRDSADRSAIRAALSKLRANASLVIFPEGRLAQDSVLQRIQPGAALIALKSGAPIIPVGLARTNCFLPYGEVIPRASHLPARVLYGKPIYPREYEQLKGRAAVDALTERIEREIRTLTGQGAGPEARMP